MFLTVAGQSTTLADSAGAAAEGPGDRAELITGADAGDGDDATEDCEDAMGDAAEAPP